ncbi:UNVERIFIED_CONTAM: hypothetical protein Cloal_4463 [Acetivibrio alkalicellulosi]
MKKFYVNNTNMGIVAIIFFSIPLVIALPLFLWDKAVSILLFSTNIFALILITNIFFKTYLIINSKGVIYNSKYAKYKLNWSQISEVGLVDNFKKPTEKMF